MSLVTPAHGQVQVSIQDCLKNADATNASGRLVISWDFFTTALGVSVDGGTTTVNFLATCATNNINFTLTPNIGATPAGTSYRAQYYLDNGASYRETWVVQTSTPQTIAQIRVLVPPVPTISFLPSQVQGGTANRCARFDSTGTLASHTVDCGVGGGSLTLREVDGAPSFTATTLEFQQADGFVVTDQTGSVGRVALVNAPDSAVSDTITLTNITQITNRSILDTTATLTVARGGTSLATLAANQLYAGRGTSAPVPIAAGTAGQVLISQGAGADPAFLDPLVSGITAHDAPGATTNPVAMGGYASAAAPLDVSADVDVVRAWALRNGSLVVNLASGGTLIGGAGAPVRTDPTGTTTQPISAASLPLPTGAATLAEQQTQTTALQIIDNLPLAQGSTTAGQSGILGQGAVTTAAPTYTTGQTSPLSLTTAGGLRVDGSATTQPVSGTFFQATQPVSITAGNFPDNEPFNVAQINGVTPLMGNGVTGTGSPRVTIASDNTAFTVNVGTFPDNEPFNLAQLNAVALASPFDADTGAGTQNLQGVSLRKSASGGSVELGTATDPLRTDPTGATTQPVSAASLPLPTGAATLAEQQTQITALQLIDNLPLAQGSTTAGQSGALIQGAVTTGAPTYTTGQTSPLSLDTAGALRVTGGGGGTEYVVNAVTPADPTGTTVVGERDDQLAALTEIEGDWTQTRYSAKGALWVTIPDVNGDPITSFGGGTQYVEDDIAAANPTGTALNMVRDDVLSGQTTADGDNVAARGTDKGELYVKHVDSITVTDGAGALNVIVDSGTITANAGTNLNTSALSLEATQASVLTAVQLIDNLPLAQGSTTAGQSGALIQGAVTTGAPSYTTAQTSPLSLTLAGALRVDGSAVTQPVSGTVTANAGTGTFTVGDGAGALNVIVDSGTVTANAGTNLNTSALSLEATQASVLTAVQLIDDPVATLGTTTYTEATTKGMILGVIRRDADTSAVNLDNEVAPLQVDALGRLKVEIFAGGDTHLVGDGAGALNVIVDSGTITTVSTVTTLTTLTGTTTLTPGTAAANLGKAEDVAHATGDTGVAVWGIRDDTLGAVSGTELDYEPFHFNAKGALWTADDVNTNTGGPFRCTSTAIYSASTSGNTELVAISGSTVVYVCSYHIVANGTVAVRLVNGTGTACATGEDSETPTYDLIAQSGLVVPQPDDGVVLSTAAGDALCIETSGAVEVHAMVNYVQF